ncbi:MAG: TnpV protein [Clostridia bacterium]|nr:TnpV protein [Clostridia bacterium]
MEQHIYNEHTGISYTLQGDYYLPDLALPEQQDKPIGLWGQRHLKHIKQHRKILHINLLTSGKLNDYLADIDKQAEDMFFQLVKQMSDREGITEQLKADNQMKWAAQMNNIRSRATEIINYDIIYS